MFAILSQYWYHYYGSRLYCNIILVIAISSVLLWTKWPKWSSLIAQQLLNSTGLLHLLKEVKSTKLVVDFPNIGKATNFNAADNHNYNKPCHHDHRLKNICPNNSLQTTLQKENGGHKACRNNVIKNIHGSFKTLLLGLKTR